MTMGFVIVGWMLAGGLGVLIAVCAYLIVYAILVK